MRPDAVPALWHNPPPMETRPGPDGPPGPGRAYDLVLAAFVAVLLISNVASTKILVLGPFTFDGGTILFPASYIFGDILTEVYGYRRSRRVIWAGFAATALMAGVLALVGALPPAADWPHQEAFGAILGQTPRIVLASLLAYFVGEFSNSWILSRMKVRTRGRWLFARTIGSTLVGEGLDTAIFVVVAFAGALPGAAALVDRGLELRLQGRRRGRRDAADLPRGQAPQGRRGGRRLRRRHLLQPLPPQ